MAPGLGGHAFGVSWPARGRASVVAASVGVGAVGLATCASQPLAGRGLAGLAVCHGMAGAHSGLDLRGDAYLRRVAVSAGRCCRVRGDRSAGAVLCRGLRTVCGNKARQQGVGSYHFCSALVACRACPWHLVDRVWLGRRGLRPRRRAACRLGPLGRGLRPVRAWRLAGHDAGATLWRRLAKGAVEVVGAAGPGAGRSVLAGARSDRRV